jgi:16S rRNA processing protein RimM
METIPKSDCQKIGFIRKTHGVHGEMVLEFEPEFEGSVAGTNRFFLEIDGLLVPFFLTEGGFRHKSANKALITFDSVGSGHYASRLVSCPVYLYVHEIAEVQDELPARHFLHFRLLNEDSGELGIITAVDDYSGNIVLTIQAKGRELLVPFNPDLLLDIDEKNKSLTLRLPEGLSD